MDSPSQSQMVVSKPLVFTASTASLKDLVCNHKTGNIKREFASLLRGVAQHAHTMGEKIEEALAELEEVKMIVAEILKLAHNRQSSPNVKIGEPKYCKGIDIQLRKALLNFVLEQINKQPVKSSRTTPHYNTFYEFIRYETAKLQNPQLKGNKRVAEPKFFFTSQLIDDKNLLGNGMLTVEA